MIHECTHGAWVIHYDMIRDAKFYQTHMIQKFAESSEQVVISSMVTR